HDSVVHQERLDRHLASTRQVEQARTIKSLRQWLRTKAVQARITALILSQPVDEAETTWVSVTQDHPVFEYQIDMIMLSGQLTKRHDSQAARHAQMPQQGAFFGRA